MNREERKKIIDDYCCIYQLVNGYSPTIQFKGSWIVVNGWITTRISKLPEMTERLRERLPKNV